MVIDESTRLDASAGAEITRGVVLVEGRRVSYLSAGGGAGGQTILLVHGSGVSARYWINQLRGLGRAAGSGHRSARARRV
jgi:pimeloyl-ACP methyl ester carboxylesterase